MSLHGNRAASRIHQRDGHETRSPAGWPGVIAKGSVERASSADRRKSYSALVARKHAMSMMKPTASQRNSMGMEEMNMAIPRSSMRTPSLVARMRKKVHRQHRTPVEQFS
jgi:hypothetical protein